MTTSALNVVVTLRCEANCRAVGGRIREVLSCLGARADTWPSVEVWRAALPEWFVRQCAPALSRPEADEELAAWRRMSPVEQRARAASVAWSLAEWLDWMRPERCAWRLERVGEPADGSVEVSLTVDGWPAPIGAFEWLARAAGATVERVG